MSQIITAIAADGRQLGKNDPRWDDITFNILVNLYYSVRVISAKIP